MSPAQVSDTDLNLSLLLCIIEAKQIIVFIPPVEPNPIQLMPFLQLRKVENSAERRDLALIRAIVESGETSLTNFAKTLPENKHCILVKSSINETVSSLCTNVLIFRSFKVRFLRSRSVPWGHTSMASTKSSSLATVAPSQL